MQGERPTQASAPIGAVFLSYASQDAGAAQRICESLRAAGIEVWFDLSELRGGDAWDHRIRNQIRDCRLFIPVISASTEGRDEGYFRREWSLAVDRTRDIVHKRAFLVPVVIDGTSERGAAVPEKFHELQWTRLPDGDTPSAFVDRIRRLLTPDGLPGTITTAVSAGAPVSEPAARRPSLYKAATWGASAIAGVACAYFIADRLWLSKHTVAPALPVALPAPQTTPSAGATAAFKPPAHSIAVLPFVNMSGDKDQDYFSDGMTEELINALAHIESLKVTARTSAFSFKGENVDVGTVARKLDVGVVLEGSIRRSGNTVRITAQLIDASNGFHIWSQDYDRQLKDTLTLQTEIATTVARELRATLLGDEAARIGSGGTTNPDAYVAYLRGTQLAATADDEPEFRAALAAFDEALRLDPKYALAHARRADELIDVEVSTQRMELRRSLRDAARESARLAVALAPDLAEAHVALGFVYFIGDFDFASAGPEIERALTLAPGDARVQLTYAAYQTVLGHHDVAIAAARSAVALDPQNYLPRSLLVTCLHRARRFDEALVAAREARALKPDTYILDWETLDRYLALGQPELARQTCESRAAKLSEMTRHECLAIAYHALNRHKEAQEELSKLQSARGDADAYVYAEIYAQWRDPSAALRWLAAAERLRDPELQNLRTDWRLDPIRATAEFKAVERRLNFPP